MFPCPPPHRHPPVCSVLDALLCLLACVLLCSTLTFCCLLSALCSRLSILSVVLFPHHHHHRQQHHPSPSLTLSLSSAKPNNRSKGILFLFPAGHRSDFWTYREPCWPSFLSFSCCSLLPGPSQQKQKATHLGSSFPIIAPRHPVLGGGRATFARKQHSRTCTLNLVIFVIDLPARLFFFCSSDPVYDLLYSLRIFFRLTDTSFITRARAVFCGLGS